MALLTAALAALTVTACGGGDDSATPPTSVAVAHAHDLGDILVDSQGRTVYLFEKDAGTRSACSGDCALNWPPVTTPGTPTVASALSASKVGTTRRSDGTTQVTYNGHPLYRFEGDRGPGDANGQGLNAFGAPWYVVSPAGTQVTSSRGGGY